MFSPASVTRSLLPGLSRLVLHKTSGNVIVPSAAILIVVVIPKQSPGEPPSSTKTHLSEPP
jgi:hypothetical protein